MMRALRWFCGLVLTLAAVLPASADLRISEFMATNTKSLQDEDGEFPDWVEIQNTGSSAVDLDNWFLTDDAGQLSKWRFPSTNLPPQGFLVVFASGKDRQQPGAPLHTNFKLSGSGEYLGLVAPGGKTVVSAFSPAFPAQFSDVSYGYDTGLRSSSLMDSNSVVKFLVSTNDALGTNWLRNGFDDSSWKAGRFPVGYELGAVDKVGSSNLLSGLVGYWKLDETNGATASDSSGFGNAGVVSGFPVNASPWTNGIQQGAIRFRGSAIRSMVRIADYPKATQDLTVAAWVWADARTAWASIAKNWSASGGQFFFGLRDQAGDLDISIRTSSGIINVHEGIPLTTGAWHHVAFTADGNTLRLFRDGNLVGSVGYSGNFASTAIPWVGIGARINDAGTAPDTAQGGIWNGRLDDVAIWNRALSENEIQDIHAASTSFGSTVRTDLSQDLYGRTGSAFLRIPFVVSDPKSLVVLSGSVRYNDGAALWLNGEPMAQLNSPENPSWDGIAPEVRPSSEVQEPTVLNLSDFKDLLLPGTNIVAVQLFSRGPLDPDLFFDLSLEGSSSVNSTNKLVYFTTPTPGRANRYGVESLGPVISEVQHVPNVPQDDQDLVVTAKVLPTFGPLGLVALKYRVMFTNEVTTLMNDEGKNGDAVAGDSIFTGIIPASASLPGQMVRYAVVAADNQSRTNRIPLFPDRLNSEEYFGTVVQDNSITSAIPVMHWFLKTPSAAENDPGTQCSLFYDGEFYDNVYVRIRGGTSRSWLKKSYKVEMTPEHEFRIHPGVKTVTEFDLNTTYTDKSYVRARLHSELQQDSGMPSPEIFHLRLQQNARFYSVTLWTEQVDAAFLRRYGLDDNGALYKGGPGSNGDVDSSFEKKTRRSEDNSDLKSLIKGLTLKGTPLENYVFDNIDLPAQVEFIATVAVAQNIDATDKNYFLYRDTLGNGEWRMLPWDLDLSFGPNALNTDDMVYSQSTSPAPAPSHPFIGSKSWMLSDGKYNTLIDAVVNNARGRQMVLRRLRTLTDRYLLQPYFQNRIEELYTLIAPDVVLDRNKWKSSGNFGGTDYNLRQSLDRIKNEYLVPRAPYLAGAGIPGILGWNPSPQPYAPQVNFGDLLINPPSGNQAEEYVQLLNTNNFPIDLSGWRVTGDISFTFKPGTVICSNSFMYISPKVSSFRARGEAPKGGLGLFVQGDYQGQLSARGGTLRLLNDFGREISSITYPGNPSPAQQFLRITEVMFHPPSLSNDPYKPDDYEFLELRNISPTVALDLSGVRLTKGVFFTFPKGTPLLAPGARLVLVANAAAFQARYGVGRPVGGVYLGSLANSDETIRLEDAVGEKILEFQYRKAWYPITDGLGFSLALRDDAVSIDLLDQASSWQVTQNWLGSPGLPGGNSAAGLGVVVNEFSPAAVSPAVDTIELRNLNSTAVDLSGWFLTDDFNSPKKYRIPNGVVVAAGGYWLVDEKSYKVGTSGFQLDAEGDELWLFSADPASGNLTGYVHGFSFGAIAPGKSWGRWIDSVGAEHLVPELNPTLGAVNAGPRVGPLVVSEIQYHPHEPAGLAEELFEFIELSNTGASPLSLSSGWRVRGGIKLDFPSNLLLASGAQLLLVGFDPSSDNAAVQQFRAFYQLGPDVPLVGPWKGALANDHDTLRVEQLLSGSGTNEVWGVIERIDYQDGGSWPAADGDGTSLQRRTLTGYGNDPASWVSAIPSAGRLWVKGGAPVIAVQPVDQQAVAFQNPQFTVQAAGDSPLRYQWWYRDGILEGETNAVLRLSSVRPDQFGSYHVTVFNAFGSVTSSNAFLSIQLPPFITLPPASRTVRIGSNVVFSVNAVGSGTLRYQWKRDGVDVPGATNTTLLINNAQPSDSGEVSVVVSDDVGPMLSPAATLVVVVPPQILSHPEDITLLVGESIRMKVEASGTSPLTYRWRRGTSSLSGQSTALLSLTNAALANSGNYTVVVGNFAGSITSRVAVVTVLIDNDRDGMADAWETLQGFNPLSAADGAQDADGDGVSNRDEYVAGTNPRDPASYLHFEPVETFTDGAAPLSVFSFQAVSNHTYAILSRDSLTTGAWTPRWTFPSQPTNGLLRVTNTAVGIDAGFFRIQTPNLP